MKLWQSIGLKIVMCLDNGIGAARSSKNASKVSDLVRDTLEKAGFVAHVEKSRWEPSSTAKWLGFTLDVKNGHVRVLTRENHGIRGQDNSSNKEAVCPGEAASVHHRDIHLYELGNGPY